MARPASLSLPFLALAALLLLVRPASLQAADQPVMTISRFHDALIEMMKRGPALGFAGRVKFIAPVADQTFDFADMTQRAVGTSWDQMSAADQAKMTAAFRKLSISTYAHEFRSYDGERFQQVGDPRTGRKGGVLVQTQIVPKDEAPVALNYLLHDAKGWKIYDVYLAGAISEVARRRDEFSGLLRERGPAGMVAALEEKSEHIASDDAKQPVAN